MTKRKVLTLPVLISLVIGNVIGTGIFVLPASLSQFGSWSLLAWIYTSVGAVLLALTLAHLNQRFPKTGGPYVYCKEAFGIPTGFVISYTYWISNLISIAGLAVSSVQYLGFIWPNLNANSPLYQPHTALSVELGLVWACTTINLIGLELVGIVQIILTIIKLSPLVVVTLVGLRHFNIANIGWPPMHVTLPGTDHPVGAFSLFSGAAGLTFWAFIGLETATIPAENAVHKRDVFLATVLGTLGAAFVYLFSTIVLMGLIPSSVLERSQFPFADAGILLFGSAVATVIALCAVISGLGSLNASTLVQGQIVYAAARDHLFPKRFARLSQHNVPIGGQILSTIITTFFLVFTIEPTLLKQFNNIALLSALLTLVTYLVTTLSEMKFAYLEKSKMKTVLGNRSFWIALLATAYSIWMIANLDFNILVIGFCIIALCIPIYFFLVKPHIPTEEN